MENCNISFDRSLGFLFRKFNSINIDIIYSLFHSFCFPFYCSIMDHLEKSSRSILVFYHAAKMKI